MVSAYAYYLPVSMPDFATPQTRKKCGLEVYCKTGVSPVTLFAVQNSGHSGWQGSRRRRAAEMKTGLFYDIVKAFTACQINHDG